MLTIYHNPRCSKLRGALELIQQFATQHHLDLDIIDYQKTPLSIAQLTELHRILQSEKNVPVSAMVRENEDAFTNLQLAKADDATLLQALAAYPELLQRPIVRFNNRAVIARPVELVNELLIAP